MADNAVSSYGDLFDRAVKGFEDIKPVSPEGATDEKGKERE